MLKIEGSCRFR